MAYRNLIIAVGIALIATPSAAAGSAAGQKKGTADAKADTRKYCIEYEKVVGSRVGHVACKTKSEWARERVDVDEMLKNSSR